MADDTEFDPLLLDRYLAGDLPLAERARVERWLEAHPRDAQLLREAPRAALGAAQAANTDAAWRALAARLEAASQDDLAARRSRAARGAPRGTLAPWMRRVTGAAAALVIALGGVATWQATRGGSIAAPLGRDVTAQLPDGSRVTLSAGSRLRWGGRFGRGARDVALEGEGYFDVVHDEARPFRVRTRNAVAQDVGTRFVVRAWPELPEVDVAVEEGVVALMDTLRPPMEQATLLHAGQRGRLRESGVVVTSDVASALAWMRGELVFDESPLTEVLPAIGRRFDVSVTADAALAGRRLTARFAAQSLDDVLTALRLSLGVRVERSGRTVHLTPEAP
ncbi:MAG: FecR family protein [Gemmatimonas sp.]|jgi:transmembrane sensor|uniref:FecR family protein n=2 Tax=Gemmatimonas sp. TaxID=1962908 RepID=UPI0022C89E6D|nr:FecR domain-containing protein [Gemmatimonas sp.]MCA2983764.1 FecR domain-containing protein [Gemmatimonas sp.]MCA2988987.1 FecR domain-containing protein [Gemmatimonas sp.]MCA2994952.1 FecR domain-containing protein [Gemmatimonas sp.]MCZ8011882.1 FecR domain-containing protein [Gemmatimonas sp.]MCZ8265569.1 FecR domain-containing protein [Gemmatimonas sp.]